MRNAPLGPRPALYTAYLRLRRVLITLALAAHATGAAPANAQCTDPVSLWSLSVPGHVIGQAVSDNGSGLGVSFIASGSAVTAIWNESGATPAPHVAGDVLWQFNASGFVTNSPRVAPLISGEAVIFAATDGRVYCLAAATGALKWQIDLRRPSCPFDKLPGTPAVQLWALSNAAYRAWIGLPEDLIFVATHYDSSCASGKSVNRVFAVNGSSGTLRWVLNQIPYYSIGAASEGCTVDYTNNQLYVGTTPPDGVSPPTLWAISTLGGGPIWADYAGSIRSQPQLLGSEVYVAYENNTLRAYDPAGDGTGYALSLWAVSLAGGGGLTRTPWVEFRPPFRHTIYATDGGGVLHAVFEDTTHTSASQLWSLSATQSFFSTAPVVDAGTGKIYLGRNDGVIQQINASSGSADAARMFCLAGSVAALSLDSSPGSSLDRLMAPDSQRVARMCIPWASGSSGNVGCTVSVPVQPPQSLELLRAEPSPFHSATTIRFRQSVPGNVRLTIYDIHGRCVRTLVQGWREVGEYRVDWDGATDKNQTVTSGIYLCHLETGSGTAMLAINRKVAVIR
jgi:outer membrane protein assembly factor BamB